ncbi:MAG: competence protein CoiA family protein [Mobilitalea sp.]
MENCLYHKKTVCTFDLKDENGLYYEDMVLEWKQAAADRWLTCMECGAPVYLAAGPIKEPYFAHYDLVDCNYGNGHESEELKKGKRSLYYLLKRSFPKSEVQARYRMDNGIYSTFYCQVDDSKSIVIDYRLQNNSLEKFHLRDSYYQTKNIRPIYVMGIRQEKDTKQINWYQSLLQTSMGYIAFLDTEQERLTLKKSFGYRLGKDRKFLYCNKSYPIKEALLNSEGQFMCDFTEECSKIELQIIEEKLQFQRMQERAMERKEEQLRLEAIEKDRLETYRLQAYRSEEINDAKLIEQKAKAASILSKQEIEKMGLNPAIFEKCKTMIEEGNANLVSKKYYDAIMSIQ